MIATDGAIAQCSCTGTPNTAPTPSGGTNASGIPADRTVENGERKELEIPAANRRPIGRRR